MKELLILGGTQFIGRNLVERLLASNAYNITLFNRQKTQANLFPEVHKIKGDRESDDINQVANKHWDYVVDLSCFYPDSLSRLLELIQGQVDKYVFISTCSVYDNAHTIAPLRNEAAHTLPCSDQQKTDRTPISYGSRKAECERILQTSTQAHVILRPALVYGRYDPTDRLYYWLYQVQHNDTLLLPDHGNRLFSMTYVQDLVDAMVHSLQTNNRSETYNVITHPQCSIREIVDTACILLHKKNQIMHADPAFLRQNGISQWTDMPLWIDGDYATYSNKKISDAFDMQWTKLQTGIRDTLMYYKTRGCTLPTYGMKEKWRENLLLKLPKSN